MRSKIDKIFQYAKKNYRVIELKFKKYFSTNILFLSYVILSILIGVNLRAYTVGLTLSIKPVISDLMVAVIIGSFGYFFKPKNQFKYFLIIICLFTFLGVGNSIYYTWYKSFLSISLIDSLKMVGEVKSSLFDKLQFIDIAFLIYPIILVIIHKNLNKRKYYFEVEKVAKGKKMFLKTVIGGFIILFLMVISLSATDMSRIVKQWNREYIVQRFGIYTYTFNDLIQSLEPKLNTLFGYDEAAREFREFYKEEIKNRNFTTNKYTNVFEGKNLLVIHAESIQTFLIGLKINGQEITPNLNKLSKSSLYFSRFYPQIGTGTSSDTEFTFETGLMPSTSGIAFVSYFDRKYEGLASILDQKGYYTFSMHANNGDYWNRNTMYKNLGYQKFYSQNSFEVTEENTIGLGLSDKEFFKQIIPILKDIKINKEPYYGKIITLTNHSPFSEVDKYDPLDLTMQYTYEDDNGINQTGVSNYLEGTEMGNYLKSAHYADAALGELFNSLEENGLLENTVILLYGDHEAKISKSQFDLLYNYDPLTNGVKDENAEGYISLENYKYDLLRNTPLMIWAPGTKYVKQINDVVGMYDLLPTLANMFNFKYTYAMGHDIFSKNENIVIFPNGNFMTEKVYYNSLKGDYITLTDEPLEEGYIDRLKAYVEIRLSVSQNLITHDLIRKEETNLMEELKNGE